MIAWFISKAIILYAVFIWAWSYLMHTYIGIVTPLANKELQIIGIVNITKLGPSENPNFEIAVYHRDAADMQDSLFDFTLESLR